MTLGTGIAAGLIVEGRLFRGAHSLAGEFGHTIVDPLGATCSCGTRGCLESLVSGPAIVRRYKDAIFEVGETTEITKAEEVFSAARRGEPRAMEVIEKTAEYLAIGLSNLAALFDPEVIALGGGISDAGDILFSPLERYLSKWKSGVIDRRVRIVPASLGSDAGVVGACVMACLRP